MNRKRGFALAGASVGVVLGGLEGLREATKDNVVQWGIVANVVLFVVVFCAVVAVTAGLLVEHIRKVK